MNTRTLLILVIILGLPALGSGQWVSTQVSQGPNDCWGPSLASSPEGLTMLGYAQSGDPLLMNFVQVALMNTMVTDFIVEPEIVGLTSGFGVDLCYSRTGFHAAVNSSPALIMYQADIHGSWESGEGELLFPSGDIMGVDMLGVPTDEEGPDAYMIIETWGNPPSGPYLVSFSYHEDGTWSQPATLHTSDELRPYPRITLSFQAGRPVPLAFYLTGTLGNETLVYRSYDWTAGWGPELPVPEPSPFGLEFDVVRRGIDQYEILGLAEQPLCPCNSIFHQGYAPATGWGQPQNLTQDYADFDWPMCPQLAVDGEGAVHGVWYQEASLGDFTPWKRSLEYFVLQDGVWTDAGDFLDDGSPHGQAFGSRAAITAAPGIAPVVAWTRCDTIDGMPLGEQLFVSRVMDLSGAPDDDLPTLSAGLAAWPNPFNPSVRIAFASPLEAMIRVDVFDPRGRRVRGLARGKATSARTELTWDGRDDRGSALASGVYFVRVQIGQEVRSIKVVLTE